MSLDRRNGDIMEQVFYIDLKGVITRDEFYGILRNELPLPDYFGNNLDAFYDVLTDACDNYNIIFYNCCDMEKEMTQYFERLKKMCSAAVSEGDDLKIRFFE